jgi:thiosulfate/3-mercaptopyruvate sulfurtransferase
VARPVRATCQPLPRPLATGVPLRVPLMADDPRLLVSTDWLSRHLRDPDLRILDGSWYLPAMNRDARAEYEAGHIPGARFADIDDLSDARSTLPHMAPPPEKFISRMRAMGVGDGHQVVVYDGAGMFSAPRIWWLFRLMGKTDIAVLDGGLPKWKAEGRPVEDTPPLIRDRHMTVQRQAQLVKDVTQVAAASKLGDHEILDARSAPRFRGEAPEPRPGLRSGHIPGSKNVPFGAVLNPDGTMKTEAEIRLAFEEAGVDLRKPVITSCGSGVSSAVLNLALERIGHRRHALYDGSWAEWGMYGDLKVATGA